MRDSRSVISAEGLVVQRALWLCPRLGNDVDSVNLTGRSLPCTLHHRRVHCLPRKQCPVDTTLSSTSNPFTVQASFLEQLQVQDDRMQADLLERSFEAATAKYKRMHGLEHRQSAAGDSHTMEDSEHTLHSKDADSACVLQSANPLARGDLTTSRKTYSTDELTKIAELSRASAAPADILPSLQGLHLERISQSATPGKAATQQNGLKTNHALNLRAASSSVPHASSLQHDIFEHNQEPAPGIENQQNHQADHQKASAEENYSEADWAAYYQYYGYTAPPPPPPPVPQLCSTHMKLLEQMLSASTEQPEPGPAVTQQPPSSGGLATRGALQSRAQNLQDGNLTELLMAWFDAGYQTGKHEAQSQHK